MTGDSLPQTAGLPSLNGSRNAAVVPLPQLYDSEFQTEGAQMLKAFADNDAI